jgi:hypothetical protein
MEDCDPWYIQGDPPEYSSFRDACRNAYEKGLLPVGADTWDGKDSSGENVSSGVYSLKVAIGNEAVTRKLHVIR